MERPAIELESNATDRRRHPTEHRVLEIAHPETNIHGYRGQLRRRGLALRTTRQPHTLQMGNSGSAAARRERLAEQRARHAQGPVAADHYGQGIQPDDSFLRPGAGGQGNRTPAPSTEKRTVKVKNEMRMLKGSLRLRPVADGRGGGRYSIEFKVIIVARNACT